MSKRVDICSAAVIKTLKGFDEDTVKVMARDIEALNRKYNGDQAKVRKAFQELNESRSIYFEAKRQEIFLNVKKQNQVIENIEARLGEDVTPEQVGEELANIVASNSIDLREGIGRSVESRSRAMASEMSSYVLKKLDDLGAEEILNSKKYNVDILKEMHAMTMKGYNGKPVTNNNIAFEIARVFNTVDKMKLRNYRDAGIFIRELEGRTIRQMHSREKISAQGREAWISFMERDGVLDETRVFTAEQIADPKAKRRRLSQMYDHIMEGKEEIGAVTATDELMAKNSFGSIRSSIGKSRSIHFKDPEMLAAYLKDFGEDDLAKVVFQDIGVASSRAAAAQVFGTNFKTTGLFSGGLNEGSVGNIKKVLMKKYGMKEKHFGKFDKNLRLLMGAMSPDSTDALVKASNTAHGIVNMAKLSMASIIAGLTDPVFTAAAMTSINGKNFYANLARTIQDSVSNFTGDQKQLKAFLRKQLMFVESERGEIVRLTGMHGLDGAPGFIAKGQEFFFKYTGFMRQTTASKTTAIKAFVTDLHDLSGKSFDDLPKGMQNIFLKHEIGAKEWSAISQAKDVDDFGDAIISMEAVQRLDDSLFDADPRRAGKMKREAIRKMHGAMYEYLYQATPTPNNRERAALMLNQDGSELSSLAMGHAMKYKSFAFTSLNSVLSSVKRASGKNSMREAIATKEGGLMALQAISALTTMGYVSLVLRDMLRNREPREMDTNTAIEALIHGGGLGIYGDLMLRDYTGKFGGSLADQIAGPTINSVNEAFKVAQTAAKGDFASAGTKGVRFVQRHLTPFNNAPIIKPIMDEILVDGFIRQWDPDYVRRLKNYYRREGMEPIIGD